MFTGLVEDVGRIARATHHADALELVIEPTAMPVAELTLGESVACDGACLTVTATDARTFTVLAGAETLRRTTLGELVVDAALNLERALAVGARLGGHLVSGHVDGLGELRERRDRGANLELAFTCSSQVLRYVVEKGSICIDGISLTINHVDDYCFSVALIPHTVTSTTLARKTLGQRVNLEVDIIGKYVEKLLGGYSRS